MSDYVLEFAGITGTAVASVGGKGANLGELSRIPGIRVPAGFCITTAAYREVTASQEFTSLLRDLSLLKADDQDQIRGTAARAREWIQSRVVPTAIEDEIGRHIDRLGGSDAYAVRSSATAEDLPTASFAGQQDTYLNVTGRPAILRAVIKCWASLFTDRAVTYRIQNGFDHREIQLSVVVQRMVAADAAGVMFTADPITGNRTVASIDAGFGLGEAMVSGLANADNYRVRDAVILEKKIATQDLATRAAGRDGTEQTAMGAQHRHAQALTDDQILELEHLGRTIEAHFGSPQDIEWTLADGDFSIVQARPMTTLFPIPYADDASNHIYMSFGHQQMMTDAMKPLGTSFFRLGLGQFPLVEAGGRLFIDLAHDLASPLGRGLAMAAVKAIDPLIDSAVRELAKRKDFMKGLSRGKRAFALGSGYFTWQLPVQFVRIYRRNDEAIVQALMTRSEAFVSETQRRIENLSGEPLFEFVRKAQLELKEAAAGAEGIAAVYVGAYAVNWVNRHMDRWLGEKGAADVLSQSVPNNLTSAMGLDLLDVADVVRQHPAVMECLPHLGETTFLEDLAGVEGGTAVAGALQGYLDKYGMRCPGEIDITRPRWTERPSQLVPMIINDATNFAPNAHATLFERGLQEAREKEQDLLRRLAKLPAGRRRAAKTTAMIRRLRNFAGYREYPKYLMMSHYWIMKKALLTEAGKLVDKGVLQRADDAFFLSFDEFQETVRHNRVDDGLVQKRRAEFLVAEKLTVPRVMTSEGEILFGSYDASKAPEGALVGIAASSGVIEARARVVLNAEQADIKEGDVLVTRYTDPSWTPLFLSAGGLVTEVGGVATHGAVIAREYGLPAVVGVEGATDHIKDGQRVRVNGTEGYVEILAADSTS